MGYNVTFLIKLQKLLSLLVVLIKLNVQVTSLGARARMFENSEIQAVYLKY